jgi:competence protein ComEC
MELHRAPLVRLVLPFVAGILAGYYFIVPLWVLISVLSLCAIILLVFVTAKPQWQSKLSISGYTGLAINATLFFVGLFAIYFSSPANFKNHLTNTSPQKKLLVRLLQNPEEKGKTYSALAQAEWGNDSNNATRETFGKVLVYFSKDGFDSTLTYGNYVLIDGNINEPQPPLNPAEFNYKRWLANKNIYYQTFLKKGQYAKTSINTANPVYKLANTARTYFDGVLHAYLPDSSTYAVANALILGERNYIDDETQDAYIRTGTIHILAVSGLHVGAIYLLLGWVFVFFNRNKFLKWFRAIIILIGLWGYAILTGLSPSVTRAATMFSFIVIGDAIGRKTNLYNSLAASAIFILCIDAKAVFNIGFQLSYLAVIGIGLLYYPIYSVITVKYKLLNYFWQLTAVSLAAQIATFALGIFYFHQFPNYFLLSNLIIVPLAMLAVYTGITLFVVSKIHFLALWVGKGLHLLLYLSNSAATQIQGWPLSYSSHLYLSGAGFFLVYLAIITLCIFIATKKHIPLVVCLSGCVGLVLLSVYRDYNSLQNKEFTVYALSHGEKAISYIDKNEAWLWTDSTITEDSKIYRQKIEPHFIAANVHTIHFEHGDSLLANNFGIYGNRYIALHGLKVLWLEDDKPIHQLKGSTWDVVIAGAKVKPAKLNNEAITYGQLVITNPYAVTNDTNTYTIAQRGAYNIQF